MSSLPHTRVIAFFILVSQPGFMTRGGEKMGVPQPGGFYDTCPGIKREFDIISVREYDDEGSDLPPTGITASFSGK